MCCEPNKYLNQEYENMIKLTDFMFNNSEYKIFIYKEGDNNMSDFIIITKGYDAKEITNFYDAFEYYKNSKKILI